MENEELAKVLSNAELDDVAKIEAIQKLVNASYVPATVLANERKKFNGEKETLETNYKNLQTEFNDYKQSKMTDDEKKQAQDKEMQKLVEKLQKELAQSNLTISKKTASGYLSNLKTRAGIKDDDTDFEDFISNIAFEDNDKTDKISKYIANMVTNAYETGKNDAVKGKLGKMGSFKEGQEGASLEKGAFGKELAETTKVDNKVPDFFKKE